MIWGVRVKMEREKLGEEFGILCRFKEIVQIWGGVKFGVSEGRAILFLVWRNVRSNS